MKKPKRVKPRVVFIVMRDGAVFPARIYVEKRAAMAFCRRRSEPDYWNVYEMRLR